MQPTVRWGIRLARPHYPIMQGSIRTVAKKKKKNVARTPLKSAVHLHSGKSKESFPIRVSEGAPKQGSPTFNL